MPKEKSCGTIVFTGKSNPKFLLLHYSLGHWDFPKGHVEEGETEEVTALRELEEETGISSARIITGFREKIQYYYKKEKQTVFKEVIFFLIETKENRVKISHEHTEYAWCGLEGAVEQLTFANSKEMLKKAAEFLGNIK